MHVSDLNREQLEELRDAYFEQLESEGGKVLDGITTAEEIPMANVIEHYEGTEFVEEDFFCSQLDERDTFHKSGTSTYFQVADANWGMFNPKHCETEEEAREIIRTEYQDRSKGDGSDEYWRNRKQVVIKVTITKEVL